MNRPLEILPPDTAGFARAGELLREGELVAFPTETVYGLGVRADDDMAVARLFEAKGRPAFNPLIVHVPDLNAARQIAEFDATADCLAAAFWPGPLTLVLPVKPGAGLSPLVTAGLGTVGIRIPGNLVAQEVLQAADLPVAAPSANPSGQVSPTQAAHVMSGLGGQIAAVFDGGACRVGLESTIVGQGAVLLRPGGLPTKDIEEVLGIALQSPEGAGVTAPGQLASHYAPRGTIRLNAKDPNPDETVLGFGPVESAVNLSPTGDLREAAARLFAALHELNEIGASRIAVSPIPEVGLGQAINDRLRRAAAPREGQEAAHLPEPE